MSLSPLYASGGSHSGLLSSAIQRLKQAQADLRIIKDKILEDTAAGSDYSKIEGTPSALNCTASKGTNVSTAVNAILSNLDAVNGYMAQLDLG